MAALSVNGLRHSRKVLHKTPASQVTKEGIWSNPKGALGQPCVNCKFSRRTLVDGKAMVP